MKTELIRAENSKTPAITLVRFNELFRLLQSWGHRAKGQSMEWMRQRLRDEVVTCFSSEELQAMITLGSIGRQEVTEHYETACRIVRQKFEGCDLVDVIIELRPLEGYAMIGSFTMAPRSEGIRAVPCLHEQESIVITNKSHVTSGLVA